jgi:predicted membrane channel-forming protein YqfA (hemolysin III family)
VIHPEKAEGLARIRRRRRRLFLVLGMLPVVLLVHASAPWPRAALQLMVLAWVAAYSLVTIQFVFSRCPCCGQLFHSVLGWHNPVSRTCRGCGVSIQEGGEAV